uniref:RagB/SusD family nutrient uptake outer membrane protein n=1 Tax=Pedobacter schmidteae TaxID=2201271 RepID=UPI000EB34E95|nr:RagB/SusD family nutrient uptake outer membrane protein [Pedobacter schmidteae]
MKKSLYILLSLITLTTASCKKWLDVRPGTQVKQDELFSTEQGFNQAILGSYLQMGPGLYAGNTTTTMMSALGQNYQTTATGHFLLEMTKYNYTNPAVKDTIAIIWSKMYTAIGGVNNILDHVDAAKSVFLNNHYNLIKGQALGLRALMHFDLLRMFGPVPINGQNVNAVPYIKTFGKQVTPLSTTSQVITACLDDLNEAEELLSVYKDIIYDNGTGADEFTTYTRNHFNYWAAKALKARIYLYKGDKINAAKYAKEVIASGKFPFVNRATFTSGTNQDRTFSTEHIFALNIPTLKPQVDRRFRLDGNQNYQTTTLYLPQATMKTLFEEGNGGSTDYRFLYLINTLNGLSYSTKFWQNDGAVLQVRNQMPMIRLSEMYYIAAEATPDLGEALTLVNKIRVQRGLDPLLTPFNETSRMQEIAKEYNKEFYAEGQLFFYYKRLGTLPIPRSTVAMTEKTYVFPLPDDEIEFGNR